MGLIVKASGGDFTPAEAGTFTARCARIVDLGTQEGEYKGKKTSRRKVAVYWEIPDQRTESDDPMLVRKMYTASLGDKAPLRKDLETWRGRKFTDGELKGFDLKAVLNAPCLLTIVHANRDGNTYANVESVTAPPRGVVVPPLEGEEVFFSLDDFDPVVMEKLSESVREQISASPEYAEAVSRVSGGRQDAGPEGDDDIPF